MPAIAKMNSADFATANAQQNSFCSAAEFQSPAKKKAIPTAAVFEPCTLKSPTRKMIGVADTRMHPQVDPNDSSDMPQAALSAARHKASRIEYRRVTRKTERVGAKVSRP